MMHRTISSDRSEMTITDFLTLNFASTVLTVNPLKKIKIIEYSNILTP